MTHSREEQAAKNNAIWCDTICRAHGSPGEFHNELWLNRYAVPRFYPNVVTLSAEDGTATQLTSIQTLAANGLSGGWGVKDSFCSLDLITLGFKPLFEARWLWRSPFRTGKVGNGMERQPDARHIDSATTPFSSNHAR
jgi:hypothetical protein